MTIIQKMLVVPVLSLLLYSFFVFYSYSEHQQSNQKLTEIREQHFPLLELVNTNNQLFLERQEVLKDAVSASESNWLQNAKTLEKRILTNLDKLSLFPHLVKQQDVQELTINFAQYAESTHLLAKNIISNQQSLVDQSELIQNIEHSQKITTEQFFQLKLNIQIRFKDTINQTIKVMDRLLLMGSIISLCLMLFLLLVTFIVSRSTYNNVYEVILRMKSLALGDTDFSQRLVRTEKDELGYLIHWFNKLSDKLEQDYTKLQTISITDKLTQLNNRTRTDAFFSQILENNYTSDETFAVVLLDIDHFKAVNDNFGHQVGDEVLKSIADILKKTARSHDFIARWGGEELY